MEKELEHAIANAGYLLHNAAYFAWNPVAKRINNSGGPALPPKNRRAKELWYYERGAFGGWVRAH